MNFYKFLRISESGQALRPSSGQALLLAVLIVFLTLVVAVGGVVVLVVRRAQIAQQRTDSENAQANSAPSGGTFCKTGSERGNPAPVAGRSLTYRRQSAAKQ